MFNLISLKTLFNPVKNARLLKYPYGNVFQLFGENVELYKKAIGTNGHNGIDIVSAQGTPILASTGTVVDLWDSPPGYGKHIRIMTEPDSNGNFFELVYAHLESILVKKGDKVRDGQQIGTMGNCFDKETEVLTDGGWKLFSKLNHKERVATLNPETDEIEYHKPISYTKRKEEYIWKFRNYHSLDFAVSGNHTMYIEKQDGKMYFVNFEDLPKFSWIKQSGGIWNGIDVEKYHVPKIEIGVNQTTKTKLVNGFDVNMNDWLAFLGWWITDGSICGQYEVRITQSFNNPQKRETIEDILDRLPFIVRKYKEDYIIGSKQLVQHLKKLCPNKQIPNFIKELSPRQIRIFLDAFWGGDGWQHKSTKYYMTPIKLVADDLQELIMKCGGYATIKKCDPTKIHRIRPAMIGSQVVISRNPYYLITEGKHRMGMIKKEMAEKIKYNDFAYCLTVQNHIIYVRRNGRPMWCGNTGFVISGNTPYWGNAPAGKGVHLHFGVRDCTLAYCDNEVFNDILKVIVGYPTYTNRMFGYRDPMLLLEADIALTQYASGLILSLQKKIQELLLKVKGRDS